MLKYADEVKEIEFILANLREEDRAELEHLFGAEWFQKTLDTLKNEKCLVLYGQGNGSSGRVPISTGGFYEIDTNGCKTACVWLLTTKFAELNKTALMRVLRNQLYLNGAKYDILYNFIYKSNYGAKLWLKKLGFSFDNPHPENIKFRKDFEFFYKKNERNKKCV